MSLLTVNQVSKKLNISSYTIRFYDNQGLFPEVTRDTNGNRLFSDESLEWVHLVICLRNTGMSISDIKHFIELCKAGDATIPERYNIILAQKKKAEADLEEMHKRLRVISGKEKWYRSLLETKNELQNDENSAI